MAVHGLPGGHDHRDAAERLVGPKFRDAGDLSRCDDGVRLRVGSWGRHDELRPHRHCACPAGRRRRIGAAVGHGCHVPCVPAGAAWPGDGPVRHGGGAGPGAGAHAGRRAGRRLQLARRVFRGDPGQHPGHAACEPVYATARARRTASGLRLDGLPASVPFRRLFADVAVKRAARRLAFGLGVYRFRRCRRVLHGVRRLGNSSSNSRC